MAKSRRLRDEDAALQAFLTQLRSSHKHKTGQRPDLEHMGLVVQQAYRYRQMGERLGQDMMDLVQAGYEGLRRALERFDPERGYKFSTMARWWIMASITRLLAEAPGGRAVRMPGIKIEALRNLQRAIQQLTNQLERPPSHSEIVDYFVEKFGQTAEETHELMALGHYYSQSLQDTGTSDNDDSDGRALTEQLEQDTYGNPDQVIELRHDCAQLADILHTLDPRTQHVVSEKFGLLDGEPKTLQYIGDELNLSRERVRQILANGLKQLQHYKIE